MSPGLARRPCRAPHSLPGAARSLARRPLHSWFGQAPSLVGRSPCFNAHSVIKPSVYACRYDPSVDAHSPRQSRPASPNPDDLLQVEQLLSRLGELEEQLQGVREGLIQSHRLATLGTIATIIAHEYNNILTPVVSYAQLALSNGDDAALMRKAVEKALTGAEKASQISNSLLGFAREADEQLAAPLPRTVDDAVQCLARPPAKDGYELTVDVPEVRVAMSPVNLQQVILNLFLNARRVLKGTGGCVTVTGEVQGSLVRIQVSDNGPGIPEKVMERIFEPFVTEPAGHEPPSPSEPKGTGLGLSICRDLVRDAGGSIEVESEPGCGTTFTITLPRLDELFERQ